MALDLTAPMDVVNRLYEDPKAATYGISRREIKRGIENGLLRQAVEEAEDVEELREILRVLVLRQGEAFYPKTDGSVGISR